MNSIPAYAHEAVLTNNGESINEEINAVEETVIVREAENDNAPAYAYNVGLTPGLERGFYKPKEAYDWSNGSYEIEGDTSTQTHLYTSYYFTDFTDATLSLSAQAGYNGFDRGDVTVRIYRMGITSDKLISTETIEAGKSKTFTLSNFDSEKKYYIKFSGTFHVVGTLTKN